MGSEEAARRVQGITFEAWSTLGVGRDDDARSASFDEFRFSPDRTLAFASGGWQVAPLAGGWGECYYAEVDGRWRTLLCTITAIS